MKRKYITNTYLRDIEKYQIKLFLDEEDYYISVKKLISVRKKGTRIIHPSTQISFCCEGTQNALKF